MSRWITASRVGLAKQPCARIRWILISQYSTANKKTAAAAATTTKEIPDEYRISSQKGRKGLSPLQEWWGRKLVSVFKIDLKKWSPVGVGQDYYGMCRSQGLIVENQKELSDTAKFYYETMKLPKSFNQWFQITSLHVWMLFVRLRGLPQEYSKIHQQVLVDQFFMDIQYRLRHDLMIRNSKISSNYLKDFHLQLRGCLLAYDYALLSNDCELASALWRNLFNGQVDGLDYHNLQLMVRYVRTQLYVFDNLSDDAIADGRGVFLKPWLEYEAKNAPKVY